MMNTIHKRYLSVENGHQIYFENCGNPEGQTILFLHGGPGLGTARNDKSYFDLTKVNLILFDQRGCGKSKPLRELNNNASPKCKK